MWISQQPCPHGHMDIELVTGELNGETLTLVMRCKTCDVIFFNAIINTETQNAAKGN
jgi:hypothetical protein